MGNPKKCKLNPKNHKKAEILPMQQGSNPFNVLCRRREQALFAYLLMPSHTAVAESAQFLGIRKTSLDGFFRRA
jgi:hypothetical protein